MKNLVMALAAISLATLLPATPAAAATPVAESGILDFCRVDVPTNHPEFHLGNCVGLLSAAEHGGSGYVPQQCRFVEIAYPAFFNSVYDSYEDCVRDGGSAFN